MGMRREDYERRGLPPVVRDEPRTETMAVAGGLHVRTGHSDGSGGEPRVYLCFTLDDRLVGAQLGQKGADQLIAALISARNTLWP